jgi:hypothetical protein
MMAYYVSYERNGQSPFGAPVSSVFVTKAVCHMYVAPLKDYFPRAYRYLQGINLSG